MTGGSDFMRITLKQVRRTILCATLWKQQKGQDLIEYALMAAFLAVAAGATFPTTIMPSVSTVFSKVVSTFAKQPAG
jgi:Flp pilus assembly pilin Flp